MTDGDKNLESYFSINLVRQLKRAQNIVFFAGD
jgi:hypothetical protein